MKRKKLFLVMPVFLFAAYLLLAIPEGSGQEAVLQSTPATKQAFAWNQDAYWKALEAKYAELRQTGCSNAEADGKSPV